MRSNKLINARKLVYIAAALIGIVFMMSSCARKVVFQTSPAAPAAAGYVKIKRDKNNNYSLDVRVRNLAEARRLDPPRETYIVWIDTERNGAKNIGQIKTSSGLFSSKLKASLKAVTSFKPTRVFLTAEDNASAPYPGMQLVLQTNGF